MEILDESEIFQNKEFQAVKDQIRETELTEANKIRSMSRVKWLGTSDEPYQLFFTLLKAKQQRENMAFLITDNGEVLEDEGDILNKVSRFYEKLIKSLGFNLAIKLAREELLQFTTNKVTWEQRMEIEGPPIEEELRKIVKALPRGKSPGLDSTADKWWLKDSRPLTMLTIIYKVIAKLLVVRFNPHSKALISPQ